MNKLYFFITSVAAVIFTGCGGKDHVTFNDVEVDVQKLQKQIYEPTATKYEGLQSSTVLYLDHSTCVIWARQNSKVFNALRPQLGQYSDTLRLIKGGVFETIPLDRLDNKVFQVLQTIQHDIPYSDILKAVEQITNGNQQAILITDCEFIEKGKGLNGSDLWHDENPYLSEPFKNWIAKGHSIYIVVEPYQEQYKGRTYDKKLFYFFFSNDEMNAPITHNMLNEIEPFLKGGLCKLYRLTNSDIYVQSKKMEVAKDLTFNVEFKNGFEYISIDDSWNDIRKYIMKLDKYGEPLPEEKSVPVIKNLIFNDGENYAIADIEVVATNISSQYLALEDNTIIPDNKDMSEGFVLDKSALENNKLNVFLTEKIFDFLTDEYDGNLIRLDFVITKVGLQPSFNYDMFTWRSLYNNESAICVAKSIKNVLKDIEILPINKNRRVIHTIFIKTESYK